MKARSLSIRTKLTALSFILVAASFATFTFLVISSMTKAQEEQTLRDLSIETEQVLHIMSVYDAQLRESARLTGKALASRFSDKFTVDSSTVVNVGGTDTPEFRNGEKILNNEFAPLDRFTADMGAVATVFARRGDDLIRVTTSLKKEDGSRAVGTILDREHPAYKKLLGGEAYIGKARLFGKDYMTSYAPIKDAQGKVIGVLFVGFDMTDSWKALTARVKSIKIGETGYFYALDAAPKTAGVLTIHPTKEGTSILDAKDTDGRQFIRQILEQKQGTMHYPWLNKELGETQAREKVVVYGHFEPWNWVMAAGGYTDELARATIVLRNRLLLLATIAALLLCVLLYWAFTRFVTKPLARAVEVAERVGEGDLTVHVEAVTDDEAGRLLQALGKMSENLKSIVTKVRSGVDTISTGSQQIAAGNSDLSQRTEEQASSLEETASSMEELTSTVKLNADNAREANQLALGAAAMAVKGGEVVGEFVSTMNSISESSKKIVDIISVIDGIAFQTNILALNAAVEAARAGEQGRGFAVVASEVRTLAQRSGGAAKEIKALISDSARKVEGGAQLVSHAGKTMEEVVVAVRRVTDVIGDISAAVGEQSSGIEQINQAVTQMDRVTQQNAALVEEAAAAAESMHQQAQALSHAVAVFNVGEGESMRAAPRLASTATNEELPAERRGSNRAKNVTRLASSRQAPVAEPSVPANGKTGTDDDCSEF